MSNWTHVAGIIRVDSIRFFDDDIDFDREIGKECTWDSDEEFRDIIYGNSQQVAKELSVR